MAKLPVPTSEPVDDAASSGESGKFCSSSTLKTFWSVQKMEIKKQALFEVIELLQKNIDENLPEVINVEIEDFYWEISEEDLYNPVSTPEELTLGQLSEDWSELSRLMDDRNFPISYDLRRLSAILLILRKYSIGVW